MTPFIGRQGRRELGKTSKKVYENIGGQKKARLDYKYINIYKKWDDKINSIIEDLRKLGMSISTFKDEINMIIKSWMANTLSQEEREYLKHILSEIDYFQSYLQKRLVK
jgi:DNA-binding transcriptional MerR regulator